MALVDKISKAVIIAPGGTLNARNFPVGDGLKIPKASPFDEYGGTGLNRTRGVGYVYEEWLRDLTGDRAKRIYREMRDNDAVIGSMFFALETILRKASWRVDPAKGSGKAGDDQAQFVRDCLEDMSHTWEDTVAEGVSMFAFGFSLFETVYKRRKGPIANSNATKKSSKFNDGLIGWRKFAPRAQETIPRWIWDEEGGLQGAIQQAPPDWEDCPIPIEKLLLFRTTSNKNNPEGRSLLRNCYRPWFFKRRVEEVEGIGIERDLCGLPVLYATQEAIAAMGGMDVAKSLVRNIRVDNQAGVVLPFVVDEKGNQLVKLELMKSAGSKTTNVGATIQRYNQDMLNTILAGFIQFGQGPHGSRALHMSATEIFSLAISAYMDSIAAVMNRYAIPRLLALNSMDLTIGPKLVPGEIGVRDLPELATYIQSLSMAGLTFFDKPTTDYLRQVGGLPEAPPEVFNPPDQVVPIPGQPTPGQPRPAPPGNPPEPGTKPQGSDENTGDHLRDAG